MVARLGVQIEFETKQFSDYKDQFQWFLAIGLLFLILDVFLLNFNKNIN